MTATLNLFARLLERARRLQRLGLHRSALAALRRLCRFPDLPADLAAEAHARAGAIWLRHRRYRRARRHLAAALARRPGSARYHYWMGLTLHRDPAGDHARAARHYRRSLALCPRQPRCLGAAGLLAVARGRDDEGVALLRRAVGLAPADPGAVGRLVRGLCQAGRPDEALAAARAALFEAPRCPRLRQVWIDLQLARLRRRQETAAGGRSPDEAPLILPFVRVVGETPVESRPVREDGATALPGPHLVRLQARRGRRRAP